MLLTLVFVYLLITIASGLYAAKLYKMMILVGGLTWLLLLLTPAGQGRHHKLQGMPI